MPDLSDLASRCIRCGFCLESCPTFVLTGDESQSPRGRIHLARHAHESGTWTKESAEAIDSCVGCLACQTACPSGVQYGELLELARSKSVEALPHKGRKLFLRVLTGPTSGPVQIGLGSLSPTGKVPGFVSKALSGQSPVAAVPEPEEALPFPTLPASSCPAVIERVALLEGCVMAVLYPGVHLAAERLLRRVGVEAVRVKGQCCGALQAHSGYLDDARAKADNLCAAVPDGIRLVTDSAGCGSTLKSYGSLLGQKTLADRTVDLSEILLERGLIGRLNLAPGLHGIKAVYQDACHLAHGQGVRSQPRELLSAIPGLELVEMSEPEMCCGSAGTYNVFQPKMARQLLEGKWANIQATGAELVVTANPGCHGWLRQASEETGRQIIVRHLAEVLEAAFSGPHTLLR